MGRVIFLVTIFLIIGVRALIVLSEFVLCFSTFFGSVIKKKQKDGPSFSRRLFEDSSYSSRRPLRVYIKKGQIQHATFVQCVSRFYFAGHGFLVVSTGRNYRISEKSTKVVETISENEGSRLGN